MGDRVRLATAWALLGVGDLDALSECIAPLISTDSANPIYRCQLHAVQAEMAIRTDRTREALETARGALSIAVSDEFLWESVVLLEVAACATAKLGDRLRAVRLFAAAQQRRLDEELMLGPPCHIDLLNTVADETRRKLGEGRFARAWSDGQRMTLAEAAGHADAGPLRRGRALIGLESLTPAEERVMRLVGDGLTNMEIARRLLISPETVKTHLLHIFNKLDVRSRTEVAALAAHHGYLPPPGE